MLGAAFAVVLLGGSPGAARAAPEPLVVTHLHDPDPNYIPPPEPKRGIRTADGADESASIDQAMEDFGRAIGQAGMVIRQKVEAKCREGVPGDLPAEQRYAWEARCSYRRY